MDIFRNPDEAIREVEQNEERREEDVKVEQELEESPEDHASESEDEDS